MEHANFWRNANSSSSQIDKSIFASYNPLDTIIAAFQYQYQQVILTIPLNVMVNDNISSIALHDILSIS